MNIADFLSPNDVMIDVAVPDKQKLLSALARKASSIVDVQPQQVLAELEKREELGSTGVGGGVALPHARFQQLKKPVGVFFRLRKPIAFDAVDEEPIDLVFLLLLPEAANGEPLDALASIARKLRKPEIATALRGARDGAAIYRTLSAE
jgi:PTS system nitrogen regulatory IIA component